MQCYEGTKHQISIPNPITQVADMPYPLYLSLQGKYFVGYADDMEFSNNTIAWAGLVNPINSKVNLFVYVVTITNTGAFPLHSEVWFNTNPPGRPIRSDLVTPANTAICPLPVPKVNILQANNVSGEPEGGTRVYQNTVEPEVTDVIDQHGSLIFPPSGSLIVTLSYPEAHSQPGSGRVAFGWAEEKIICQKEEH